MKQFLSLALFFLVGFPLTPRVLGQVVISEFMASNASTLADEDREFPDWIEVHNTGATPVDLQGWSLTDDPAVPTQWTFPSTNLASGGYLIVFASGKNRRVPGAPLHTGFRLSTTGDYLALVAPNGTAVSAFAPFYPPQVTGVSFGLDPGLRAVTLLPTNASGRFLVPTDGALGTNWLSRGFDDGAWQSVTSAVGYALGALDQLTDPGLANRLGAYWKFDETSGTTAADATGQGSPGTLANFPADNSHWVAGRNDGALRFRGPTNGDHIRVANYPRASNAITIAAWVLAESRPTWASIAKNWAASGGPFHFGLRDTGGDLDIFITTTAGQFSLRENTAIPLNQWQHVAFTADGTTLRLYRNGALVGSAPYTGDLVPPPVAAMGVGAKLNNAGTAADTGAPGYWHGRIDDLALWHRALSANELQSIASAGGLGGIALGSTVRTAMVGANGSALLRFPFVIDQPAALTRWRLKMRYDDGFVAWINGEEIVRRNAPETETLAWNATATAERSSAEAGTFEEFNLTEFAPFMVSGTNVLAIQGLNLTPNDPDFLVQPSMEAASVLETTNALVYFTDPSPGAENRVGVSQFGPIIHELTHTPAQPADGDDLVVKARVVPTFVDVASVTLRYRIQFGAEVSVPMLDDGLHGDGPAGDRVYGASIPANASTNGQMIRYAVAAADVQGATFRLPIFQTGMDADEYRGTVVQDPAIQTSLPVFHWFVATPALAESATGTRCSLFYRGEFYDNIFVRIRGGTSRGWPKKSYKIELNEDHEFEVYPGQPRVTEFDFNTTYTDKSYARSVLVYEHQRDAGLPSPLVFLVQLRQNSAFYSVTLYTEQPDKDFLRRVGLDPSGTFYKCGPGSTYDTIAGLEKKFPLPGDNSSVLAMFQGLGLSGAALETFVFDQINVPGMVNFMATVAITQNIDASDKNHFLYQDPGSGEWRMLPWDQDLTFGPDALNTDTMVYNRQDTNAPACASHPFIGARPYMLHAAKYNRLLEVIVKVPRAREMLLRRIRTLTDAHLATGYFERRIDELVATIGPDVLLDKSRWGGNVSFGGNSHTLLAANNRIKNEYLTPRLAYLTGSSIAGVGPANPKAQPPNVTVLVQSAEFNPASGNQAQEFICLTNASGFPIDLTGWRIDGGIEFAFPPGAVLPSNGVVYLAADVRTFRARTTAPRGGQGLFVLGNFQGQLSARGETIRVRNQFGQAVQTYAYAGNPSLAQQFLRVTELMYHPSALAGDARDAEEFEFIELQNVSGNSSINLAGVRFINGIDFSFSGSAVTTLGPGDSALVVRNEAAFRARYGAGPIIAGTFTGSLENGGERVQLIDAADEEILDFSYNNAWHPITDGLGFSLVAVDPLAESDAWGREPQWRPSGSLDGTPGQTEPAPNPIAPIVISEALTRTDVPPPTDTIELHNPTGTAADVTGWYLTDDFNTPRKFRLPTGSVISAGGYLTFDESQFNAGPVPFGLSSDGDEVWLFSADAGGLLTGYVHGHRFGAAENGVSFGRVSTSDAREHFAPQTSATLGAANSGPRVGPVVINEIHYHPLELSDGSDNGGDEFIELRNISGQPVPLFDLARPTNTWRLSGGVSLSLPAGRTLASSAMALVVNFDPTNTVLSSAFRTRFNVPADVELYGPLNGKLNNAGDRVELHKPTDPITPGPTGVPYVVVDEVEYRDSTPWPVGADGTGLSLQRAISSGYGPEPMNWVAAPVTAGRAGPTASGRPVLLTGPASRNAVAYQTVQFVAEATGTPAPHYQWRFNDASIGGATNASLLLNGVQPSQAGEYSVLVYNENGSVLSTNATLTLTYPAFILQQPASVQVRVRPDPQAAPVTNASFQVTAYSPTALSYQWQFNGEDIPGAVESRYTVTNVQVASGGDYAVWITDAAGSVLSAPAKLIPLVTPVLLQGPLPQIVVPGATVTLSAAASGHPLPLAFEWRRGSTPLLTNTVFSVVNSFRLTAPSTPFTTNQYRVVIKNQATVASVASVLVSVVTLPDFDQDGLVDLYEQSIGLNTNNAADALLDQDGDGMVTADEIIVGTNPFDGQSILRLRPASSAGWPGVEFLASSNRTFTVQFTDRIESGANTWNKLRDIVASPTSRLEQVLDPVPLTNRVYRVVSPAQP